MDKTDWRPITELEDLYAQPLLLASPRLVDLDCNPVGISDGFWQDSVEFDGMTDEEALFAAEGGHWVVRGWDMCNDEFTTLRLRKADVTHFLVPVGPYDIKVDVPFHGYQVFLGDQDVTYDG